MRVQGCYASDAEIENVTSYVKKDHATQYNMEVQEEIEKLHSKSLQKEKIATMVAQAVFQVMTR